MELKFIFKSKSYFDNDTFLILRYISILKFLIYVGVNINALYKYMKFYHLSLVTTDDDFHIISYTTLSCTSPLRNCYIYVNQKGNL